MPLDGDLPDELIVCVAEFLSLPDLLSLAETSRRLQRVILGNLPHFGYEPHRGDEVAAALVRTASESTELCVAQKITPSSSSDDLPSVHAHPSVWTDQWSATAISELPVDVACRLQLWRTARALVKRSHGWTGAAIVSLCTHDVCDLLGDLTGAGLVTVPRAAILNACQRGFTDVLKTLHAKAGVPFAPVHMEAAACAGQIDIIQFLLNYGVALSRDCARSAAYYGHLNLLEFFQQKQPQVIDSGALEVAAAAGHSAIVKWLLAGSCFPTHVAVEQAAMHGHEDIVRMLFKYAPRLTLPSSFAVDESSSNGHAGVVKYLIERDAPVSTRAMDEAAENGHLEVVELLHAAQVSGTANAIDYAARNGHRNIVCFLLEVGYHCTSLALDLAACYGHVEILQLLHDCGYRCSHVALIYALNARHMPTVHFLHKYACYPFIPRHLFHAVHIGFLEGVEFLLSVGVRPGEGTVEHACTMGFLEIVQLLMLRHGQPCTADGLDYACARGHFEVARFLAARGIVPSPHALRGACRNGHISTLRFIIDRFALQPSESDYQAALTAGHVHILAFLDARAGLGGTAAAMR